MEEENKYSVSCEDANIILESQWLIDQLQKNQAIKDFTGPTVKQILTKITAPNFVTFKPMIYPTGFIKYNEKDLMITEEITAKTRWYKSKAYLNEVLDPEVFGQRFADDIDKEIFSDLINNVGHEITWDFNNVDVDTLKEKGRDLHYAIYKAADPDYKVDWIVTSPSICKLLYAGNSSKTPDAIEWADGKKGLIGNLRDMKLYCDINFPQTILMGSNKGYFYCPYIMLTVIEDSCYVFMNRYAKKLIRGGSNYYTKINVKNVNERE